MKTRAELLDLAYKIRALDFRFGNPVKEAIQLLNDLHSEGMRDAADVVKAMSSATVNRANANLAILSAIENKPKL